MKIDSDSYQSFDFVIIFFFTIGCRFLRYCYGYGYFTNIYNNDVTLFLANRSRKKTCEERSMKSGDKRTTMTMKARVFNFFCTNVRIREEIWLNLESAKKR